MRRVGVEAMEAMADMRAERLKTSFSTDEIARKLGLPAWRVRRSLKAMAGAEFALVWPYGNDRWCIDPRLVRLLQHIKHLDVLEDDV